jgi:hypothetical protein
MKLLFKCAPAALVMIAGILNAPAASAALMGQYNFEEGSGTTANDSSGLARHGTLTGATGTPDYVAGLYPGSTNSLRFNYDPNIATSYNNALIQRVALPANTAYSQNAPALTLMAWVQPDVIANQGGTNPQVGSARSIVGVSETAGGTRGILQLLSGTGQVRVLGRRVDGGGNANFVSTATLTPGQKYFLVGIMDYVGADIRVYINGVQQAGTPGGFANLGTAGPTNTAVNNTNATAFIGTNTGGAGEQWNGMIDGVRIFDHALTADEIMATYRAEVPEPATLASACLGLLGLASVRRRRSNG